jgi:putative glycosyltransferase (TIGR04372 family)
MIALNKKNDKLDFELSDNCFRLLNQNNFDTTKKFVTIHVRESGYWDRKNNKEHSTKNGNIVTYLPAIKFLISNGFQVVRIGDPSMTPIRNIDGLFDYAHATNKNDELDLFFLKQSEFFICTCSGPYQIAASFGTPILATNWIPVHILPFSSRDYVLLKRLMDCTGKFLTLSDMLRLNYGEFSYYYFNMNGLTVIDNSGLEILDGVKKMLANLNNLISCETVNPVTAEIVNKFRISSNCEIINNDIY